jgi:hypothetical protein
VVRGAGLALGRAKIGFQAPAIAAVGVAVAVQGGQCGGRIIRLAVQNLEAAAVQRARVRGHEVGCGGEVDGHVFLLLMTPSSPLDEDAS